MRELVVTPGKLHTPCSSGGTVPRPRGGCNWVKFWCDLVTASQLCTHSKGWRARGREINRLWKIISVLRYRRCVRFEQLASCLNLRDCSFLFHKLCSMVWRRACLSLVPSSAISFAAKIPHLISSSSKDLSFRFVLHYSN